MLFNSFEYIFLFLPFVFFVYFYLNAKRLTEASKAFLVISSLFFYSWWNIIYLPLILLSMIFNFVIGTSLTKESQYKKISKKQLLTIGIIGNVSLLGYFKYADFFLTNFNFVFNSDIPLLHLALPLAISFFTFQQIAYLVDSYRKETKEYDFLNYAVFVTFFPQLIAGPIVHHKEMMPQFANIKNKVKIYRNIVLGIFIFSLGLFKKVVIADTFAIWANYGFDEAVTLTFIEGWITLLSYSFQLYFDFSGYTDMAIGAALLFNIRLPLNFNSPYKSTSIIEMWDRWHMTLSRFINKYVFKTIVKSFQSYSFSKGMIAVFLSMMVSGIWHGAGWTFVVFGAIHGIALVINHVWKKKIKVPIHPIIGWFLTFSVWNFALIFFRAESWNDAMKVLASVSNISFNSISLELSNHFSYIEYLTAINIFIILLITLLIILFTKNSNEISEKFYLQKKIKFRYVVISSLYFALSLIAMSLQTGTEFLYFNF